MVLHILQHVAHEGPGIIADWATAQGHELRLHPVFTAPYSLPTLADSDGLVVLGGPMSVHEEAVLPWLQAEKAFIRDTLAAGRSVLGICLGAQLVAEALGGEVAAGEHLEIGWHPVQAHTRAAESAAFRHTPTEIVVLHWHGETFSLPPEAVPFGSSAGCRQQGFSWRQRTVGLQFHPEASAELLGNMLRYEGHELAAGGKFVQTERELLAGLSLHGPAVRTWLYRLLDELFGQS